MITSPCGPQANRFFFETVARFNMAGMALDQFLLAFRHMVAWYERLHGENVDPVSVLCGMLDEFDAQYQKQYKKPSKHIKLDFYIEPEPLPDPENVATPL
jgi:hypothetical protein